MALTLTGPGRCEVLQVLQDPGGVLPCRTILDARGDCQLRIALLSAGSHVLDPFGSHTTALDKGPMQANSFSDARDTCHPA